MAALRTTGPAVNIIFRFAAQPAATRRCTQCLRAQQCPFSSSRISRQSAKRPLMTVNVRPQAIGHDSPPPPARTPGVPATDLASSEQHSTWPPAAPWSRVKKEEAKDMPSTSPSSPASTTAEVVSAPKKTSKLRPRKAPITLTPKAVDQLRDLFNQPDSKYIRIGVKNRGCSGLAYHLEYVDQASRFDETVEQDGVRVLIDSKALFSIIGSEMDWWEDKLSARFIFRNPNITDECGCGESFSIS